MAEITVGTTTMAPHAEGHEIEVEIEVTTESTPEIAAKQLAETVEAVEQTTFGTPESDGD